MEKEFTYLEWRMAIRFAVCRGKEHRGISFMGIITGYLALICLLLLLAKFVTRRIHNDRLDRFFLKLHKPVSAAFVIMTVVHLLLTLPVFRTRSPAVILSGIAALIILILMITLCHSIKNGKEKMHWHRILSVILLLLAVVHIVTYYIDFGNYQRKISKIEITQTDLSRIKDGQYTGEYDAGYIYAKVSVTVKEGKITGIDILEHRNERGQSAESITDRILEEQSLSVDAVSGATNSSLVIKKACENALQP